ncbi:MAG: hypothetical protein ACJAXJ_004249, partial [Colwellia sp.]
LVLNSINLFKINAGDIPALLQDADFSKSRKG